MNKQIEFTKFPSLENTYRQKEIDKDMTYVDALSSLVKENGKLIGSF